mgnify:CR=1 FL=1
MTEPCDAPPIATAIERPSRPLGRREPQPYCLYVAEAQPNTCASLATYINLPFGFKLFFWSFAVSDSSSSLTNIVQSVSQSINT